MSYIKYNKNFDGSNDKNNFWLKIENTKWHHHCFDEVGYYVDGILSMKKKDNIQ